MSDTVEFGGWPRPPRWAWAVAVVAAVAVVVGVVVAHSGRHRAAASPASAPPVTSSFRFSPSPGVRSAARWPSAQGACGEPGYLPQIHLARLHAGVRVSMLVGGPGLWQVTAGRTVFRPVTVLPDQGLLVIKLVAGPDAEYAFAEPRCSGYLWVYRIKAGAARRLGTTADDLLGGPDHAWAVTYRDRGVVLSPLNGGRAVTLKTTTSPVADTRAGLVVVAYDRRAAQPSTVELIDPKTGALVRRLAAGAALGAGGRAVLVSLPDCGMPLAHRTCTLETIDLATGRTTATFKLPAGRAPVSGAVFSPDGTQAAFQLARARPDSRFPGGTPLPPADVAVLNLRTGTVGIVPGLELPPGTQAGLAFDATGRWLLATVSEGNHGELLAWRQGMPGPALVTSLPGPLVEPPPLLSCCMPPNSSTAAGPQPAR